MRIPLWPIAVLAGLLLIPGHGRGQEAEFDLLIRRGLVYDGTGAPGIVADVAVRGDRISLVSRDPIDPARARRVINARGMVVAPGFIDAHAHVAALASRPLAESHVRQGVTTVVYAADGGMPWPLARYLDQLRAAGHAPNAVFFAGHNQIRRNIMGTANRFLSIDGQCSRAHRSPGCARGCGGSR